MCIFAEGPRGGASNKREVGKMLFSSFMHRYLRDTPKVTRP